MNFHVLTLFPDMIIQGIKTSITGRAIENELISLNAIDIRDFTNDKHKKVDDYPYGGGAGMVMQAEPILNAFNDIKDRLKKSRVIHLTPQGHVFTQAMAKEFAQEENLVFLCGHYEGIDERALDTIVTDHISIGDYVLTGGELPAMVMIDSIARLIPGVLNNQFSAETESFENGLLEHPQYTRPDEINGLKVPEVLLSGNHGKIEKWRREESLKRTLERRPDLLEGANLSKEDLLYLDEISTE